VLAGSSEVFCWCQRAIAETRKRAKSGRHAIHGVVINLALLDDALATAVTAAPSRLGGALFEGDTTDGFMTDA